MKNGVKKGQFYLIAAIIIIVAIFGIFTVSNYVKKSEKKTQIYDLKQQFGLEGMKVIEYSLYNNQESEEWMILWAQEYFEKKGETGIDNFILVYGNATSLILLNFTYSSTGEIDMGGNRIGLSQRKVISTEIIPDEEGRVKVQLGNYTYTYDLLSNQNLILLIKEGDYVA